MHPPCAILVEALDSRSTIQIVFIQLTSYRCSTVVDSAGQTILVDQDA